MDRVPTTKRDYEKLAREADQLEQVTIPEIRERIAEARAEGDLKENAEYHGQRENLAHAEAKLADLRGKLAGSYIADSSDAPADEIVFGRIVTLRDLSDDTEERYQFVGPGGEDWSGDILKILVTSPLAQQLLNHRVGENVTVETPAGEIEYEVLAVEPASDGDDEAA